MVGCDRQSRAHGQAERRRRIDRVLAVAALLLLAPALRAAAQPADAVALVAGLAGSAQIRRGDETLALHAGARLHVGDRIVTAADGKVKIEFVDRTLLIVGANTDIAVASFFAGSSDQGVVSAALSLLGGIVRATLGNRGSTAFYVVTRTAVASTRSTEWVVESQGGRSSVFVVEGRVDVTATTAPGGAVLAAGEGIDLDVGTPVGTATRWGQARVAGVLARTTLP